MILDRIPEDHAGPIDRVPEICAEIPSRNRVYDRVTKRYLHADGDVREFRVVEPTGPIERYSGEGLADREELHDRLTTPLLPGLSIDIPTLLGSSGDRAGRRLDLTARAAVAYHRRMAQVLESAAPGSACRGFKLP